MSASAIDDFDAARAAVNAGMSPGDAARGLVAKMSPEERLWCLDGDLPGLTGLVFIGLEDGYPGHRSTAPSWNASGFPVCVRGRPTRVGPVQQHLLPGVDGPGGDLGSGSRGASRVAIGADHASGATLTGAVCVNVLRHPAWGRAQETYGEDPFLVGSSAPRSPGPSTSRDGLREALTCNSMETQQFSRHHHRRGRTP